MPIQPPGASPLQFYALSGDSPSVRVEKGTDSSVVEAVLRCPGGVDLVGSAVWDGSAWVFSWSWGDVAANCIGDVWYTVQDIPLRITIDGETLYGTLTVFDRDSYVRMYVTPEEVASYLGLSWRGPGERMRVARIILDKMEYVDRLTNSTWNGRVKEWEQYHDMKLWKSDWPFFAGAPLHLQHRCIREVKKLEVYTGNGYRDMTAHLVYRRGGGDVWLDRVKGVLYWQHWFFFMGGKEFYIHYTYGCDELPGPVRELTLLLTVRDILVNERRVTQLPASDAMGLDAQLRWVERRIVELERMLRAWRLVTD